MTIQSTCPKCSKPQVFTFGDSLDPKISAALARMAKHVVCGACQPAPEPQQTHTIQPKEHPAVRSPMADP